MDALDPNVLTSLINRHVGSLTDSEKQFAFIDQEERERELLKKASARWSEVVQFLDNLED